MRITFDTNIFITALINTDYKKAVDEFINRQNSFLSISLSNEIKAKLLKVHAILVKVIFRYSTNDKKFLEIFNEPDLIELKKDFDNLYDFLISLKEDPNLKDKVELMADITTSILSEMNKVRLHPVNEDEISPILLTMESTLDLLKRKIMNNSDIKHLLLPEAYARIFADDETYFISNDFVDIINNKKYIEEVLNYVKVFDFANSPISLM